MNLTSIAVNLMERKRLPDSMIRAGIRRLLKTRLNNLHASYDGDPQAYMDTFLATLNQSGIAEQTDAANDQHYELPAEFFYLMLGSQRKYSSGLWPTDRCSLDESEERMFLETAKRADLKDGQEILELGCGWGSLSLWMARHYPLAKITAVSNSSGQRKWIQAQAKLDGLSNLEVITTDMNQFVYSGKADRIVSIEMFEHMRNYSTLFRKVKTWLKPEGFLFLHVFAHKEIPYLFEDEGAADWMAKYFFSGGTMPSHDLFKQCQDAFTVEEDWVVNGVHYSRTLEAWLEKLDDQKEPAMAILTQHYGDQAEVWFQRWRIFLMACSELFAYQGGLEWHVSHYRLSPNE